MLDLRNSWTELKLSFVGPYSYQGIDRHHRPIDFFLSQGLNCNCVLDPNCSHEPIAACEARLIRAHSLREKWRCTMQYAAADQQNQASVNCGKNAIARRAAAQEQQPIVSDAGTALSDLFGSKVAMSRAERYFPCSISESLLMKCRAQQSCTRLPANQ